jgi:hypothetical protein
VGVEVIVIEDEIKNDTPDALFPNNWVSFHQDGTVGLYPIFAQNRRRERRKEIIDKLTQLGFGVEKVLDYSHFENEDLFLEGTGSLILDRLNKKAY